MNENLKLEDMKTRNAENLLRKQETLAKMGKGVDEGVGGLNMPVVAPTTNNNDNKTINITNNNIFGGQTDPLEGLYSKLPTQ